MAAATTDLVSLDEIKRELRIDGADQDDLLADHIAAAQALIAREIEVLLSDLDEAAKPALKQAVILCVRQFYEGYREIRPTEAFYALVAPWRRYG